MTWLIIGLILFLGAHSIRMVADAWRTQVIASWGEKPFKGVYTLIALVGFYAMVTGYAEARLQTVALWTPRGSTPKRFPTAQWEPSTQRRPTIRLANRGTS